MLARALQVVGRSWDSAGQRLGWRVGQLEGGIFEKMKKGVHTIALWRAEEKAEDWSKVLAYTQRTGLAQPRCATSEEPDAFVPAEQKSFRRRAETVAER